MSQSDTWELRILESKIPKGVTVPPARAAKLLGVSAYTLKKRASEWGLHTFWDVKGRQFSLNEIEMARKGLLEPAEPDTETLDFRDIRHYSIPDGYGFIVYGKDPWRYLERYLEDDLEQAERWVREKYGTGEYLLKLVDPEMRMTGYNFSLRIEEDNRLHHQGTAS